MKYSPFNQERFQSSVEKLNGLVAQVLDDDTSPRLAEEEAHSYEDKFGLAETVVNMAIAAQMNCFVKLGLSKMSLVEILNWVHKERKSVTLRFQAEDDCKFLGEQQVEGGSGDKMNDSAKTQNNFFGAANKRSSAVVSECHWNLSMSYKILVYPGTSVEDRIQLQRRDSSAVLSTKGDGSVGSYDSRTKRPLAERTVHPPIDIPVTWFFRMISPAEGFVCQFSIERSKKSKRLSPTPRRNREVQSAVDYFKGVSAWCENVQQFFAERVEKEIMSHVMTQRAEYKREAPELSTISIDSIFCPILPLLERGKPSNDGASVSSHSTFNASKSVCSVQPYDGQEESPLLSVNAIDQLLCEQIRTIEEALQTQSRPFPPHQLVRVISKAEAVIILLSKVIQSVAFQLEDSVDYIEQVLKRQLVSAMGRETRQFEFIQFMHRHNQMLFKGEYTPKSFVYDIGQKGHCPDGTISIEMKSHQNAMPVDTIVRYAPSESLPPLLLSVDERRSVEMKCDRYAHAWIVQGFAHKSGSSDCFHLNLQSRQLSQYLVIIGSLVGRNSFEPRSALIVQNMDQVLVPLSSEAVSGPSDLSNFTDSISPIQRDFVRMFRDAQSESPVFAICVVQIKSQLEKVLGLPTETLSNDVRLNQDIISLFVDYQIPSDLMSYRGPEESSADEKVTFVKRQVRRLLDIIQKEKAALGCDNSNTGDLRSIASSIDVKHSEDTSVYSFSLRSLNDDAQINVSDSKSSRTKGRKNGQTGTGAGSVHTKISTVQEESETQSDSAQSEGAPSSEPDEQDEALKLPKILDEHQRKADANENFDFTELPKLLEDALQMRTSNKSLQQTVIKAGSPWQRRRQESLVLKRIREESLSLSEVESEKRNALNLLDGISRGGTHPIECADLHLIIAATQNFDNDFLGTIVQDNTNPVERIEKSTLQLASVMFGVPVNDLVLDSDHLNRLAKRFPSLFDNTVTVGAAEAAAATTTTTVAAAESDATPV